MAGFTRARTWAVTSGVGVAMLLAGCSYGTTQPATDITDVGATLHGYVLAGESAGSTYWFEYGTSPPSPNGEPAPGHVKTPFRTVQIGDGRRDVEEAISGLEPDTVYHFRLCARDTEGQDVPGCNDPQQFRTDEEGPPSELSVSTEPALFPGFDQDVSDYVTRCADDPVEVDVEAPADTTVAVDGGPPRSGRFSDSVDLSAGQRFEISTATGATTSTHHVRCLPATFPNWTYSRTGVPSQAWTLTSLVVGTTAGYVAFFDGAGVPVWWYLPDGVPPIDAKLLSDNTVAFAEWSFSGFNPNPALKYQVRRLEGSLVRRLQTVGTPTDFHDLQEAGNGNFLLVSYKPRDHVDLSAFGKPSDATVVDAEIQEVTPAGALVWSWNSKDHIGLAETGRWWAGLAPNRLPDGRDAYDYAHINAVEPDGDGLLISLRHTDAIYRINRDDGQVEWKLGGTTTGESLPVSGDSFSYTLGGQHDVRRLADGTVSVFDNGTQLGRAPRALRYRIDPAARTAALVESLSDSQIPSSVCCGGARKLDSNGWLLQWGGNPIIAEYAADMSPIFRLRFPGVSLYRAFPVPRNRISADQLRQGMDSMFPR